MLNEIVKTFTTFAQKTFHAKLGFVAYPCGKARKMIIFDTNNGAEILRVVYNGNRSYVLLPYTNEIVTRIVDFNKQFTDYIEELYDLYHIRYRKRR